MHCNIHNHLFAIVILFLALGLSGCEVETAAYGTVTDAVSGAPVAGAHVMQVAIYKKSQQLVGETYTDSTGSFAMDAGPTSFGARKVKLALIVEKDRYTTALAENNYGVLNIKIRHY